MTAHTQSEGSSIARRNAAPLIVEVAPVEDVARITSAVPDDCRLVTTTDTTS